LNIHSANLTCGQPDNTRIGGMHDPRSLESVSVNNTQID
jgi:hypothetical protein